MPNDSRERCYVTFPDMPVWCRYCHAEGHTSMSVQSPKHEFSATLVFNTVICRKSALLHTLDPSFPLKSQGKLVLLLPVSIPPHPPEIESPPSSEALKSQWAPTLASTNTENIASTVSPAPVEKAAISKYSSNRYGALEHSILPNDSSVDNQEDDMDDDDYRPENDDQYSSTDDDLESCEELAQGEVDVLMQESTATIATTTQGH